MRPVERDPLRRRVRRCHGARDSARRRDPPDGGGRTEQEPAPVHAARTLAHALVRRGSQIVATGASSSASWLTSASSCSRCGRVSRDNAVPTFAVTSFVVRASHCSVRARPGYLGTSRGRSRFSTTRVPSRLAATVARLLWLP